MPALEETPPSCAELSAVVNNQLSELLDREELFIVERKVMKALGME